MYVPFVMFPLKAIWVIFWRFLPFIDFDISSQVVSQLKATCNKLSEEQLAKLGVALFNCQSEVEGRPTFLCTEEMVRCTIGVFK